MNKKIALFLICALLLITKMAEAKPLSFIFPVYGIPVYVTSPFGANRDYDNDGKIDDKHEGIDFRAVDVLGHSSLVRSAAAGRVIWASDTWINTYHRSPYGKHVIIDHGDGIWTTYGHLSTIYVTVGQEVSQGYFLGLSGDTGNSTNIHLHFHVQDWNAEDAGFAVPNIADPTDFFDW